MQKKITTTYLSASAINSVRAGKDEQGAPHDHTDYYFKSLERAAIGEDPPANMPSTIRGEWGGFSLAGRASV